MVNLFVTVGTMFESVPAAVPACPVKVPLRNPLRKLVASGISRQRAMPLDPMAHVVSRPHSFLMYEVRLPALGADGSAERAAITSEGFVPTWDRVCVAGSKVSPASPASAPA